ncbi:MAG: hypothetical protein NUV84_03745 [Candidatus Uhrbacteria bacterium]|nr:hypothetical protein [Candidatus Uhrbacteria bacterium]
MSMDSVEKSKAAGMCPHMNFPSGCKVCKAESESGMSPEMASEILGSDRVLGAERVRQVFGVSIEQIPKIHFSKEQLEQAKERGAKLIYRIESLQDGKPITLESLTQLQPGIVLGEISGNQEEDFWLGDDSSVLRESPRGGWNLVETGDLAPGTEFLSAEAQMAFMRKDYGGLQKALEDMNAFWDSEEIVRRGPPREMIDGARQRIPDLTKLKALRESLPANANLPKVVEAVYDLLLSGKAVSPDLVMATASSFDAGKGEPVDRPLDISIEENGVRVHSRRDMRFGRPNSLGNRKPGIAIGYIQY